MTTAILVIPALVLVPLLGGIVRPHDPARPAAAGAARGDGRRPSAADGGVGAAPRRCSGNWLALDALGRLFLGITSTLFLAAALYAVGYLARETGSGDDRRRDLEEDALFVNAPEAVFTGCLLFFLATMTLVCVSNHLGLLWVAVEATTLASAPLIYFHRHHRSLEAAWKYLLICSVGIALALLGNFLLAVATQELAGAAKSRCACDLLLHAAASFQPLWLKAAFIFLLVGYGTKMGLAPLHTWLPDAHSEAPSLVSALLSGALLNCAFLGDPARACRCCAAAGLARVRAASCSSASACSRWASPRRSSSASPTTSGCSPTPASSTWGSSRSASGWAAAAVFGALLHAVNHSLIKGDAVPRGRQHPQPPTARRRSREVRGLSRVAAGLRRALAGGLLRHHRLAAVRHLPERVHDPARPRIDGGRTGVAIAYPDRARGRSSSAWRRSCCGWCRDARRRPRRRSRPRAVAGAGAAGRCSACSVLALGLYLPPLPRAAAARCRACFWEDCREPRRLSGPAQRRGCAPRRHAGRAASPTFARQVCEMMAHGARLAALFVAPTAGGTRRLHAVLAQASVGEIRLLVPRTRATRSRR